MRKAGAAILLGLVFLLGANAQPPKKPIPDSKSSLDPNDSPSSIGGKNLEQWKKELSSDDASRRAQAILAIMQFGDEARTAVPLLLQRINDSDVSPRARALLALRTITVEEKDIDRIVKTVATRLLPANERQAIIRYEAILTLQRFVAEGQPAIPSLIAATKDTSSWQIRHSAVELLWRIGVGTGKEESPPDGRITEALLSCIRDTTYQVKLESIQGLGAMGRPANPALLGKVISTLQLCTNTRNEVNRPITIWAYSGLVAMQDGAAADAALNKLAKYLKDNQLEMRVQAAMALGVLKSRAKKKLPDLVEMLKDKEPYAIQAACTALSNIGDSGEEVLRALLDTLGHKDPSCVASAITALVNLKQTSTRVLQAMEKIQENKDLPLGLRVLAQEAIKELKKPPTKK